MRIVGNKNMDDDIVYFLKKLFYTNIQKPHLLRRLDRAGKSLRRVSELDVWFALRSVFLYFRSMNDDFRYSADDFKAPKTYSVEEVLEHLRAMYSESLDKEVSWFLLCINKEAFGNFMAYLNAFCSSLLYQFSFAVEYENMIAEFAAEDFCEDHANNEVDFSFLSNMPIDNKPKN